MNTIYSKDGTLKLESMEQELIFKEHVIKRFKNTESGSGEMTKREKILLGIATLQHEDYQKKHSDKKYSREEAFKIAWGAFNRCLDWNRNDKNVLPPATKFLTDWFNENYPETQNS